MSGVSFQSTGKISFLIVVAQCDLNCPANFILKSFPTCLLFRPHKFILHILLCICYIVSVKMSIPTATLAKLTNKGRSEPVRIRVIDKQPKQSSSTKVSYQRMVFSDREGTKLTCTLFELDINVYEEILIRGNYYDIKNMIVKEVPPPRFASYDGEKQLYFTNSTSVFPVIVTGESSKKVSQYTIIIDVTAISSTDERFDMILLVLKMHPEKMVPVGASLFPVREISVTDSNGEEILIVSAWNQRMIEKFNQIEPVLLEDPVVDLRGLKISKYSGFSLATSLLSEVKLWTTCDEATALRTGDFLEKIHHDSIV